MEYLRLCLVILLVCLVCAHARKFDLNRRLCPTWELTSGLVTGDMPTFNGLCQLQGDWCTTNCQIAGGRDGLCNKVGLCVCRPL